MEKGAKTILILIVILILTIIAVFIKQNFEDGTFNNKETITLNIISSNENIDLENDILDLVKSDKIELNFTYDDTLAIMDRLNAGEQYDAVWMSNSLWMNQITNSSVSITNSKSTSINPVIFGIKKSKAESLGFVNKDVYTKDLVNKIANKELKFAMSNPTSTDSGASAYLGILSTLAGNPEILTSEIINTNEIKSELKTFFTGLERTSGNEEYLEELFLNGDYDAVVTYESTIIRINQTLVSNGKEPLYAIYPVDGVSISDSTLAYIDNKDDQKKEAFLTLQNHLLSNEGQQLLEKYGRRTWYGGINENVPQDIFNSDWGINTTKYITPIKYPSTSVINEAIRIYQDELRKPVHIVFCLDYSGSMKQNGINELRSAMKYILSEDASNDLIQFKSEDKIDIIPFATTIDEIWSSQNASDRAVLINKIYERVPNGSTALYPAASSAIKLLENEDSDKYNSSVIIMTDGLANVGNYNEFRNTYKAVNKNIPIYSIMFGLASEKELNELASITNGKVFDGKENLIGAFKEVRGYN